MRKLAQALHQRQVPIEHLIISTYDQSLDGTQDAGKRLVSQSLRLFIDQVADACFGRVNLPIPAGMQERYLDIWASIYPDTKKSFQPTIEGALQLARSLDQGSGTCTLITGSLYLVGGALRLLQPEA